MANPWGTAQETAKFGAVEFDVVQATDTYARAMRVVEYDGVDGGQLVDQGARPRTTQVQAVFAGADQIERFQQLLKLNDGRPHLFVHPILGVYEARITDLSATVNATETTVTAAISFTEEGDGDDVLVIDEPLDVGSGISAVKVRSEQAVAELDRLAPPGLSQPEGLIRARQAATNAPGLVSTWQDTGIEAAQVQVQLSASLATQDAGLRELEQRFSVEAIDAHLSLSRLRLALLATAERSQASQRTTRIRVVGDTPALSLALELGKSEAFANAVLDLNPEASPLRLRGEVEVPA